jgi:hypothetical protein
MDSSPIVFVQKRFATFSALLQQNLSSEKQETLEFCGFLMAYCWQLTNFNSVVVANYGLQIDGIKFREFSLGVPTRELGFGCEIGSK